MNQFYYLLKIIVWVALVNCVLWLVVLNFFQTFFISMATSAMAFIFTFLFFINKFKEPNDAILDDIFGPNPLNKNSTNGPFISTIAHRGACHDAPENSLAAFQMCAEKNCKFVEFDITKTLDGVPIVFHDETIERLTGFKGQVEQMTWLEIAQLDITVNHPLRAKFGKTTIAKLEDVVSKCVQLNLRMIFDVKNSDSIVINAICEQFKRHSLYSKAVVTSFFPYVIYKIRTTDRDIVCGLTWRPNLYSRLPFCFEHAVQDPLPIYSVFARKLYDAILHFAIENFLFYFFGVKVVLLNKEVISGQEVYKWHKKNVRVIAWTVNNDIEKQFFSRVLQIPYITDTLMDENKMWY